MGNQSGGNARYKGPGSLWKSSWKGRKMFSDYCCFVDFDRATAFYEDPGGALDIVPADGKYINLIVSISEPIADGAEALIVRNGTPPQGWEIVAVGSLDLNTGLPVVLFQFRVYDGAAVAATAFAIYPYDVDALAADNLVFRLTAYFFPTTVGFPLGRIGIGIEGGAATPTATLTSAYSNAAPDLILGAGVGAQEDWPGAICGLAGGDGDFSAGGVGTAAHQEWVQAVADYSEMQSMPSEVEILGVATPIPGYTAEAGWRGNNPYLPPGVAPSPLLPFIGATTLVVSGGGDLGVGCGTATYAGI